MVNPVDHPYAEEERADTVEVIELHDFKEPRHMGAPALIDRLGKSFEDSLMSVSPPSALNYVNMASASSTVTQSQPWKMPSALFCRSPGSCRKMCIANSKDFSGVI